MNTAYVQQVGVSRRLSVPRGAQTPLPAESLRMGGNAALRAQALTYLQVFGTPKAWAGKLGVNERTIQKWRAQTEALPCERIAQVLWHARAFRDALQPHLEWLSQWEREQLDRIYGPGRDRGHF